MPKLIVDVDTFPANLSCPEDGEDVTEASVEAYLQQIGNRTRNLKGRLDAPHSFAAAQVVTRMISVHGFGGAVRLGANTLFQDDSTHYLKDLTPYLAHLNGATIVSIDFRVNPGAARSGNNRMGVALSVRTGFDSPASSGFVDADLEFDDESTDAQTISIAPGEVIDLETKSYALLVRSGNTASSANDLVSAIRMSLSVPGLRP